MAKERLSYNEQKIRKQMRSKAMYDDAIKHKIKNWQTEHKGYGVPMDKREDENIQQ